MQPSFVITCCCCCCCFPIPMHVSCIFFCFVSLNANWKMKSMEKKRLFALESLRNYIIYNFTSVAWFPLSFSLSSPSLLLVRSIQYARKLRSIPSTPKAIFLSISPNAIIERLILWWRKMTVSLWGQRVVWRYHIATHTHASTQQIFGCIKSSQCCFGTANAMTMHM